MGTPYYDKLDIDIMFNKHRAIVEEAVKNAAKGIASTIYPETEELELEALSEGFMYQLGITGTYKFSPELQIVEGEEPNFLPLGYDVVVTKKDSKWEVVSIIELAKYDDSALQLRMSEVEKIASTSVQQEEGKGLSTNDFTDSDKVRLDVIQTSGSGKYFLSDDGTYKKGGSGSGSGFYNVTQKIPLSEGYYDLQSAIEVVANDVDLEPETIEGMVITFESADRVWSDFIFVGKVVSELSDANKWSEKTIKNIVKSIDLYKGVDKSTLTPDANGNIIIEIPDIQVDETLDSSSTNPIANNVVSTMFSNLDAKYGSSIVVNTLDEGVYSLSLLDSDGNVLSTTETFSGGGGGGSTLNTRVVLTKVTANPTVKSGDEVVLKYIYDQIDTTTESSTGNTATATITITRGATSYSYTKVIKAGMTDSLDVTQYLAVGSSNVRVRVVTNDEAEQVSSLSWQVTVVQLKLESAFNIATNIVKGTNINIPYALSGSGTKTLKLYVDGVLKEDKAITTSTSTGTFTYSTSALAHGTHSFQLVAILDIDEETQIKSNSIYFGAIISETTKTTPIVGIRIENKDGDITLGNVQPTMVVNQYESYNIVYAVYNPLAASIETTVKVGVNTISKTQLLFVRTSLENRIVGFGDYQSSISAGSTVFNFTTEVRNLGVNITEPSDGLVLRLIADNKTNADVDKESWESLGYTSKLENFTWVGNGWVNSALRHTDSAKTTININPLTNTVANNNAISIAFKFKVSNLIDTTQEFIKCLDSDGIGFVITGQEAYMKTRGNSEVTTKFSTDEDYHVAFVSFPIATTDSTEYEKTHSGMLYLYVNGIMSGGVKRGNSDSIYQTTASNIVVTTNGKATLDLYSVKIFRKALTDGEMLNLYLTNIKDTNTLINKFLENNILNENGEISVDSLPSSLPYMIITGMQENGVSTVMQAAVNNNKDTKYNVDEILYINPDKPSKNFKLTGGMIRLQGTSSLAYPIKNYRIYFYNTSKVKGKLMLGVDSQGNGGTLVENSKYSFKDATLTQKKAIPVDCFCLKADYAESSSSHNTGTAVVVHEALINAGDLTPVQKYVNSNYDYDVRTTIDGFPMVLFYRNTIEDDPIFLSKFNFNNDKSTEDVFGFKEIPGYHDQSWVDTKFGGTNPTECWEFLNNDYPMGMFLDDDFDTKDANGVPNWTKVFEARYIHDEDLVSDFEAGTLKPTKLEALVKWVKSTSDNPTKFKNELSNYFDIKHLCDYYMITDMLGAVDQRVKNMMLAFWYNPDVDKTLAYMIFYDNDTILGVRNDGKLKYDWTIDENTLDPELSTSTRFVYAFAGHDSVLWKNLRSQFATELGDAYRRLRAKMTNDYIFSIYDTAQSQKFSERLYNIDAINKYIIPAVKGVEVVQNGQISYQTYDYLESMQGSRFSHRHYWLINRLNFFDAKYNTGAYRSTDLNWKGNSAIGAKISAVAMRDYYFTFTRESAVQSQKFVRAGETFEYTYGQEANIGTIFHFYGGDWAKKIDLSNWGGFTSLSIPRLKVLEELILGNSGRNYTLPSLAIGESLPLVKKIDVTNYIALSVLDLKYCYKLEEFIATGCTALTDVTFYEGAPITKLVLPVNFKNLSLVGLPKLENSGLQLGDIKNLETIKITNCDLFNGKQLLETLMNSINTTSAKKYIRVNIGNVYDTDNFLKRIDSYNFGGISASGDLVENTVALLGTLNLTKYLSTSEEARLRSKFPELNLVNPKYTVIEFDQSVVDPANLSNLDNETGYKFGNTYQTSGDINTWLSTRKKVLLKRYGDAYMYQNTEMVNGKLCLKGTNTEVAFEENFGGLFLLEPEMWVKGVNDVLLDKQYFILATKNPGSNSIKKYIASELTTTADKSIDITNGNTYIVDNNLYNYHKIDVEGFTYVRIPTVVTNTNNLGWVFLDSSGAILTKGFVDSSLKNSFDGVYALVDIPKNSKHLLFTTIKSQNLDLPRACNTEKFDLIDWVYRPQRAIASNILEGPTAEHTDYYLINRQNLSVYVPSASANGVVSSNWGHYRYIYNDSVLDTNNSKYFKRIKDTDNNILRLLMYANFGTRNVVSVIGDTKYSSLGVGGNNKISYPEITEAPNPSLVDVNGHSSQATTVGFATVNGVNVRSTFALGYQSPLGSAIREVSNSTVNSSSLKVPSSSNNYIVKSYLDDNLNIFTVPSDIVGSINTYYTSKISQTKDGTTAGYNIYGQIAIDNTNYFGNMLYSTQLTTIGTLAVNPLRLVTQLTKFVEAPSANTYLSTDEIK